MPDPSKIRILSDAPARKDFFHRPGSPPEAAGSHENVASAISSLIASDGDRGKAIAISGQWGSGKSTVIELVREQLVTNPQPGQPETHLFLFDAWAHQGDPLRRSFLESLAKFLGSVGWIKYAPWEERFAFLSGRKERTTTTTRKSLTAWGALAAVLYLLGLPLGVALMSKASGEQSKWLETQKFFWFGLCSFALPLIAALLAWLWYRPNFRPWTRQFWKEYRVGGENFFGILIRQPAETTVTDTAKTADPTSVEFRSEFIEMVDQALRGHSRRLLIVMDNLDRVDPTDALSIWSTMRIFFEFDGREQAGWNSGLWLLVPFDHAALKRLWKEDQSVDIVDSFINKTFQITFRVPPPVLTRWKEYFLDQFQQGFLDPELQKHNATISRLYERLGPVSPSPREIKLFLNRVIAFYLQRGDEIPLPLLALYILGAKKIGADPEVLLKVDAFEPRTLDLLGEDDWRANWREYLAAIHFNVPRKDALHVLNSAKIVAALENGDQAALSERMAEPGFWPVCEQVVYQKYGDWQVQPKALASAVRCLNQPLPTAEPDRGHAAAIRVSLTRQAVSLPNWKDIDENVAIGVSIVAGFIDPANKDRRILCERVLTAAAKAPQVAAQSQSSPPAISPVIETWIKGIRCLLLNPQVQTSVPERIAAFSATVPDAASWVQVAYINTRDGLDPTIAARFTTPDPNLPQQLAALAGIVPPDATYLRLVQAMQPRIAPDWKEFEGPLLSRVIGLDPAQYQDAAFLLRTILPFSLVGGSGVMPRFFMDALASSDLRSAAVLLLPALESSYVLLAKLPENRSIAAVAADPLKYGPLLDEIAVAAVECSRTDTMLQCIDDPVRGGLAKAVVEVLIHRDAPVWPFTFDAFTANFDRLAAVLSASDLESAVRQFEERGSPFPVLLDAAKFPSLPLSLYSRLLRIPDIAERKKLVAFLLTNTSWLPTTPQQPAASQPWTDVTGQLTTEIGPAWLATWPGLSSISAPDVAPPESSKFEFWIYQFQSWAQQAREIGSRSVDQIVTEAQLKSVADAKHLLDLAEYRARADAAMFPDNPSGLADWARVLCAQSLPKTDADATPLIDAAVSKCEAALQLNVTHADSLARHGAALLLKAQRTSGVNAQILLERGNELFETACASPGAPAFAFPALAFNDWGDLLAERARRASGSEAVRYWTDAVVKYEAAKAMQPPNADALSGHAVVLRDWAQYKPGPEADALRKSAHQKCQAALAATPGHRSAAIMEVRLLLDEAAWTTDAKALALSETAQEKLQTLLALYPDSVEALNLMGNAVSAQKRATPDAESAGLLPLVKQYYDSALALRPDYAIARGNLGNMLRSRALLSSGPERERFLLDAEQQYQTALGHRPDYYFAETGLGNIQHDRAYGKTAIEREPFWNSAEVHYRATLAVKPDYYVVLTNQAQVLFDRGNESDGEEAESWYRLALDRCQAALATLPDYPRALHGQGDIRRVLANGAEGEEAVALRRQATADFHAALAVKPDYYQAMGGLAALAKDQANDVSEQDARPLLETAISHYEEAIKIGHDLPWLLAALADTLGRKAQSSPPAEAVILLTQAEKHCASALATRPGYRYATKTWGRALHQHSKLKTGEEALLLINLAIEKLAEAKQLKPDDHFAINDLGNALFDRAGYASGSEAESIEQTAFKEYQAALEASPSYHNALANWGNALVSQARRKRAEEAEALWQQAEEKYRQAASLKPNYVYAWQGLGNVFAGRARMAKAENAGTFWDAAIENYRHALVAKSNHYWAFQAWGNALVAKAALERSDENAIGLLELAIEKFEAARKIKPDFSEALNACGAALVRRASRSPYDLRPPYRVRAREMFEAALAIRPEYPDPLRSLGELDMSELKWADAANRFEAVARLLPGAWNVWKRWADALISVGQTKSEAESEPLYVQAEEKLAKAVQLKPDYHDAFYRWGKLYEQRARRDRSADHWAVSSQKFEAALAINPRDYWSAAGLAETLAERAHLASDTDAPALYADAYRMFETATKLSRSFETAVSGWAEALAKQAKRATGQAALELYAQADDKFREAVAISPRYGLLRFQWGRMLGQYASQSEEDHRPGLWHRAAEEFAKGTELDPQINWYWGNWGDVLVNLAEGSVGEEANRLLADAREKYLREPNAWTSRQGLERIEKQEAGLSSGSVDAPQPKAGE